ncbi:MAG: T9SS type A sorting domain-containing protein [Flavobacteriales bacterium]|nr:T9SS type A sorting domain-containing protein [Flavobacteriales bacterium]
MKRLLKTSFLTLIVLPNIIVAQVNPVQIGRASNAETILRLQQNQVAVHHESNSVLFIHQQDVTIYGGGGTENGKLRYDLSTDGGATFTTDIGALQTAYTNYARFPMATFFGTDVNPFNNKLVWTAPTNRFPTPGWVGIVAGVSDVAASSPVTSTEHYVFDPDPTYNVGGLCEGLPGEFWMTEMMYDGSTVQDSVQIYKGTYNSITEDVDWVLHVRKYMEHDLDFDGTPHMEAPNIAFSPDGMTGWIALVGDLEVGHEFTYNPIFLKSSDGGATWSDPMEVDLSNVNFLSPGTLEDELKALWVDINGDPLSSGIPTCAYDFDITVDANGAPHMFVVIGSASTAANPTPDYSFQPNLAKLAVDITTADGGNTWSMHKVSPVYTFRGDFGIGIPISMDNHTQVSRTESGSHIFYSWVDSDTAAFTGSMNGIGFGESTNLAPNLRMAGNRVADGYVTCPKWVTDGDLIWEGRVLFPTMAPEAITDNTGFQAAYRLPIVVLEMLTNNTDEPCQFWYFGNDATFVESDFYGKPDWINTDDCLTNPNISVGEVEYADLKLYPNPVQNSVWITGLNPDLENTIELYNSIGQLVLSDVVELLDRVEINLSGIPVGHYNVRVLSEKGMVVKPLIVAH